MFSRQKTVIPTQMKTGLNDRLAKIWVLDSNYKWHPSPREVIFDL